ncbi:MAG TPA: hypothetical protein VGQ81_15635 [Acidobacteriota bacterium]|jgi:photosystem II stability/assembly factor-like uncharacterized protein|nr:hypothetical protein [Acidobacteriota bacterium]
MKCEKRIILIVLLAVLATVPGTAWAGINVWTSRGPELASIGALAIDPQNPTTIYAGTWNSSGSGILKSTDGARSWSAASSVSAPNFVSALSVDPQNSSTLYAATYYGVYKSIDGGTSWTAVNSELVGCWTLAVDPQNPSTIYAGTGYGDVDVREIGVFKSTDGGKTWPYRALSSSHGIYALTMDPQNPTTLYAGTFEGVFKSTDGGMTWTTSNSGFTGGYVTAVAVDPKDPSTVYAGTYGSGVFKSTDGARTWFRSALTSTTVRTLLVDPQTPSTVYAGTERAGVFRSMDGGKSWSAENSGLTSTSVPALALDPKDPSTVYAGTFGGGVFDITFLSATSPVLALDSAKYCIGASWSLAVSNATPNSPIRLLGTSNGQPWEIAEWSKTDANGSFSAKGTFPEGTEGSYTLRVEIGGVISNNVSFVVSNCKP